jgi:hypothetical protein
MKGRIYIYIYIYIYILLKFPGGCHGQSVRIPSLVAILVIRGRGSVKVYQARKQNNKWLIALPKSAAEFQDHERSIARHVQSSAPTEMIDSAGLQNQYGKSLRTADKFLRILRLLIIILQGFAHVHTTHSQINSRRKESQASKFKEMWTVNNYSYVLL